MKPIAPPKNATHFLPNDLYTALENDPTAMVAWNDITAIARNEFICWVESAKLIETRSRRINRTLGELNEGKRRPCCWPGCPHRSKAA